jgi:hypothetical protein
MYGVGCVLYVSDSESELGGVGWTVGPESLSPVYRLRRFEFRELEHSQLWFDFYINDADVSTNSKPRSVSSLRKENKGRLVALVRIRNLCGIMGMS